MNHLLHPWIHGDHSGVEIRMITHEHVGVPRSCDKDGVDAAANGCHEDLADLEADEEGKGHDDRRESAGVVVARGSELEVEKSEECAEVGDEGGTHGEYGADQAVVDECVDAPVFHHSGDGVWLEGCGEWKEGKR